MKNSNPANPIDINVNEARVQIVWNNNHTSDFQAFYLRTLCPCAHCVHELTGEKLLKPESIKKDIAILSAEPVGHYAITLGFTDSHSTGIYSYEMLRKACPCKDCMK